MKKILLVFSLIMANSAFSYTPTAESLFRNAQNPDVTGQTLVVDMKISLIQSGNIKVEELRPEDKEFYIKYLFYNEEDGNSRILQVDYNGSFAKENVNKIFYRPNFNYRALNFTNEGVEKAVYYSILASLFTNSGNLIIDTVRAHGGDLRKNRDLFNQNQLSLIARYKRYLQESRGQADTKNPLEGESTEEKERIKETLASSFYTHTKEISRVRIDDVFYWDINAEKLFARFNQTTRELEKLNFKSSFGEIEANFKNYVLYNASFVFPQFVYFRDVAGTQYRIDILKVAVVGDSSDNFMRRVKSFESDLESNSPKPASALRPGILF